MFFRFLKTAFKYQIFLNKIHHKEHKDKNIKDRLSFPSPLLEGIYIYIYIYIYIWGVKSTAALILHFGSRWKWIVNFTPGKYTDTH